MPPLCLPIKATPGLVLASRASPCLRPGKVALGDSLSSTPTHEHSSSHHRWWTERNLLELLCPGETLAPRRRRPSLSHTFPFLLCKAVDSVEDPKVAPTCLVPGYLNKNIARVFFLIIEKHVKQSGGRQRRCLSPTSRLALWRLEKGSRFGGGALDCSDSSYPSPLPTFLLSQSAALKPRSDGEKPTRENPVWKECICC